MNTLTECIQAREALKARDQQHRKDFAAWQEGYKQELSLITTAEALLAGGVDLKRIEHGEHVIYVQGDYRRVGGESAGVIVDAKTDLSKGAPRLKREYFGVKNYDRFTGQRTDCGYGMGPRHGSIVFSIGLTGAARKMELTPDMLEDALYLLANIDPWLDARAKARQAVA